jgi:hypothetical protein
MGGGKGSAPAAPNYQPIAQSSLDAAKIAGQTSADQLQWARQQYADQAPYTKQVMQGMIDAQTAQTASAQQAQQFYSGTYQPIESQFATEAQNYNTPARTDERSAQAQADVATAFSGQRQAALQSLEGYGIDPSQTRYGALDLGTRISQAAAQSAAGTTSRNQSEAQGLALQGEAINIGRGYPGQIAQSYSTATSAGQAGVNAGLNTSSTYGGLMGSPATWASQQQQDLGGATNAQNTGFNNQLAGFNANAQIGMNQSSGIGSLVGGLGMAGILAMSDRRMKTDIKRVGETDGGLPVYTFRYKGSPTPQMGVMAQDVERVRPDAVHRTPGGIKLVDYAKVA